MTCRDKVRLLDAYIDGEIDMAGALALEDHMQSCVHCRNAFGRLEALRAVLHKHVEPEPAPDRLRARLHARYAAPVRTRELTWGWGLALAAPGIAALALAVWLGWFVPEARRAINAGAAPARIVYHISSSASPGAALRNLANHLNAAPGAKIVVVAHSEGVDFLLRGARDEFGEPLEPAVRSFRERGVEFRVCSNTLERRRVDASGLIPAATLVPSGIAEIGRLQIEEGYVYLRL